MAAYKMTIIYAVTDEYPEEEHEIRTFTSKDAVISALVELSGLQIRPIYDIYVEYNNRWY